MLLLPDISSLHFISLVFFRFVKKLWEQCLNVQTIDLFSHQAFLVHYCKTGWGKRNCNIKTAFAFVLIILAPPMCRVPADGEVKPWRQRAAATLIWLKRINLQEKKKYKIVQQKFRLFAFIVFSHNILLCFWGYFQFQTQTSSKEMSSYLFPETSRRRRRENGIIMAPEKRQRKTRTKAENEKGREEEASHIFEYGSTLICRKWTAPK